MNNSERIKKWRSQSGSGLSKHAENFNSNLSELTDKDIYGLLSGEEIIVNNSMSDNNVNDANKANLDHQRDGSQIPDKQEASDSGRNSIDPDERLRLWRIERQRVAEVERAKRLERARQLREEGVRAREQIPPASSTTSGLNLSASKESSAPLSPMYGDEYLERLRGELQRRHKKQLWIRFGWLSFLLLIVFSVMVWQQFVATRWQTAIATFTVQINREEAQPALGIFKFGGGATMTDGFKVKEYILSNEMMEQMQSQLGMMQHFMSSQIDPFSRLGSRWTWRQDFLTYYRDRVKVTVDIQEGLLRLTVQAVSEEEAKLFAGRILALAEAHVNLLNIRAQADQTSALQDDIVLAEKELLGARFALSKAQQKLGLIEPKSPATGVYQLLSSLEVELADASRERSGLLLNGLDRSPLLPRLDNQIRSLKQQILEQNARLVSVNGRGSIQQGLKEFEEVVARRDIALARWEATVRTLQEARLQNLRDRRYLTVVSSPELTNTLTWWSWLIQWLVLALMAGLIHSAWTIWGMSRQLRT